MEYIWAREHVEAVQIAVAHELERFGLTVPRGDVDVQPVCGRNEGECRFGRSLYSQPTSPYQWRDHTLHLPRIFVALIEFLEDHVHDKGLFRKAGSVGRQKSLRGLLECHTPSLPQDSNAHDVASLLKQFLRELPRPLVPAHFWFLLEGCVGVVSAGAQPRCLLLACLLLPTLHLQCLCVVMGLLNRISEGAGHSLMDANNLAIVMAPTLLETSVELFKLYDNSLPTQTKIVKMLIEGVDELGKVPLDVGVASNSLKAGSKVVTETQSQDNMLHAGGGGDPLPDSKAAVRKSSVTTSISGFLSGWSNRIRRRKGSVSATGSDGHMTGSDGQVTLPLVRKSVKRLQAEHEESRERKRPALEDMVGSTEEDSTQTDGYNSLSGREEGGCDNDIAGGVATAQEDHTHQRVPPTPPLRNHLHAVKLRYDKMQPPGSNKTTPLSATPPLKKATTSNSPARVSRGQQLRGFSPAPPPLSTFASPTHLTRTPIANVRRVGVAERSHDLLEGAEDDVFRTPSLPILTPNLMQTICSEMTLREDKHKYRELRRPLTYEPEDHAHTECKGQSRSEAVVKASRENAPIAESASVSSYDSCYSASLGIRLSDLPRRKLRGRGTSPRRSGRRAGPASPVVHSACLGITGLGKQEVTQKVTCMGKQEMTDIANRKQEGGVVARQDVLRARRRRNKRKDERVDTPPPLFKILDNNKSRQNLLPDYPTVRRPDHTHLMSSLAPSISSATTGNHTSTTVTNTITMGNHTIAKGNHTSTTTVTVDNHTVAMGNHTVAKDNHTVAKDNHTSISSDAPTSNAATDTSSVSRPRIGQRSHDIPSPLHTLQECAQPRPSHQKFKSPWRWGSIVNKMKYTPARDKGSVSKRAQPYMVDKPHPFLSQSRPPLKRYASMKENVSAPANGNDTMPRPPSGTPLKRSYSLNVSTPSCDAGRHIDIQEWVL